MVSHDECIALILENHGENCETYKTAMEYKGRVSTTDEDGYEEETDEGAEFLKSLLEDYRIMLQKEYEYKSSREAIEETIRCNEYEFTEDGKFPVF